MIARTLLFSTLMFALSNCAPLGLGSPGVEESYLLAGQERPAVMSCVIFGGSAADTIEWSFNGQSITIDDNKYRLVSRTRLEVHNISGRDEGLYSCSYMSSGVRVSFDLVCIYVLGAAEFADSQTMTINALNGASVELDTRIVYNGAGPSNMNQTVTLLQLFKGDQSGELVYFCSNEGPRREIPCPSTLRTIALTDSHKFDLTLLLENVSLSDSGAYLFRVEVLYPGVSSRSYLTKSFSMSIHEPFEVFKIQQNNNYLECQVKLSNFQPSDLKLNLTKPNGEYLTDGENVKLASTVDGDLVSHTAEFDTLIPQLEGKYSCVASISLPDRSVHLRTVSTVLKSNSTETTETPETTHGNDFQISIGLITNYECGVWFDMEKSLKMEMSIRKGLSSLLATECGDCGISISDFSPVPGKLRCGGMTGKWLSYKTTIVNMDNKEHIYRAIDSLKQSTSPTIDIGLFTLSVNPSCTGELPLDTIAVC